MEKEINELIAIVQSHRDKAYRKINEELVGMYFEIDKYLSTKIKAENGVRKLLNRFQTILWKRIQI